MARALRAIEICRPQSLFVVPKPYLSCRSLIRPPRSLFIVPNLHSSSVILIRSPQIKFVVPKSYLSCATLIRRSQVSYVVRGFHSHNQNIIFAFVRKIDVSSPVRTACGRSTHVIMWFAGVGSVLTPRKWPRNSPRKAPGKAPGSAPGNSGMPIQSELRGIGTTTERNARCLYLLFRRGGMRTC